MQHGSPFPGKELLHGLGLRPCRPACCRSRCLQGFLWCWSRIVLRLPAVERLLQRMVQHLVRQPVPAVATAPAGLETLLRTLLSGHLAPAQQPQPGSFRRDWNAVVCFSCGKAGHSATRCPTLDDSFPFMLPGWTVEKTAGSSGAKNGD